MNFRNLNIQGKPLKQVKIEEISTTYSVINKNILLAERTPTFANSTELLDVFGSCWVFINGILRNNQLQVKKGDGSTLKIPEGVFSAYIPPFSVVEWLIAKGPLNFSMIIGRTKPDESWPNLPQGWSSPLSSKTIFNEFTEFLDFGVPDKYILEIDRIDRRCALSLKAQKNIINNYEEAISLKELATTLKTNPSVLSRYFKKAFGLQPIKYINQLRVMDSLKYLLFNGKSVMDTSVDSGFTILRQYNEHFSKHLNTTPSSLLRRSKNIETEDFK